MNEKEILRRTSRSFYLTIRLLPRAVRDDISLAYLLARATDTIADTGTAPLAARTEWLQAARSSWPSGCAVQCLGALRNMIPRNGNYSAPSRACRPFYPVAPNRSVSLLVR